MTKPWSIHRRAEVESQEEAIDDRTDVQKLHDACRWVLETGKHLAAVSFNPDARSMAAKEVDRSFADLIWLLENQFGDEVDVELLAKALAS